MRPALRRFGALALSGALLLLSRPALPSEDAPDPRYESWIERLNEATRTVEQARKRLQAAQEAVRVMRHRRYPRGEARQRLLREFEEARSEVERAKSALPEVLDTARQAGVPPGVLRPYEDATRQSGI